MNRRVVVTGMGIVCPVGNSVADAWQAIRSGESGIGTTTRFDPSRIDSRVSGEVKGFDPALYIEGKEGKRMALFSQYATAAAVQASRDAGLGETVPEAERTSIIIGNGIGGNEIDCDAHERLVTRGPSRIPPLAIPKLIINEAAGNISMRLGIKGRVHTIGTACASGTDAIGTALDIIRCGRADVVFSGGTEAAVTEYAMGAFCSLKALSTGYNDTPLKACRPFDKGRDGFIMGEGSGILVLEERSHALSRGARIYAELAGYGASGDAYHLTAPDPEGDGASRAIQLALADANMLPEDIDYINAHGTSTQVNDPTETKAIKRALGKHAYRLKVSSTKSMTGHCIGAAGAIEAIFSILAICDQFVPPTLNLDEPDEECDLDYVPYRGVETRVRVALSTSLGFGGHNGAVLFREYAG